MTCNLDPILDLSIQDRVPQEIRYFRVTYRERPKRRFSKAIETSEVVGATSHKAAINKVAVRNSSSFAHSARLER